MTDQEEKKEVRNIKVFGNGRLYNPDTGEYFVRFENGEALVSKEEAQLIKKYHPQVLFVGQKPKPVVPNVRGRTVPKSMKSANISFKIPVN